VTDDLSPLLADLHDHLRATEELPVDRQAGRWIGEAQAVAADLDGTDPSPDVVEKRVGHVRDLLSNVEDAGHPAATDRVADAKAVAAEILARIGG
jgi:hypothetical protein